MIYRGVKMKADDGKRKSVRDALKAVGITLGVAAVIAAVVLLSRQFGIR